MYGGQFSNHTKARILAESPLIELYKNTRIQVENLFHLDHRTTRHSAPDMGTTFQMLATYMQKNKTNELVPGRTSTYSIPDAGALGIHLMQTSGPYVHQVGDSEDPENETRHLEDEQEEHEQEQEEENVEQEIGDDGGLDT